MMLLLERETKQKECLGRCKVEECNNNVYDNQLYVKRKDNIYHYSCYNMNVEKIER